MTIQCNKSVQGLAVPIILFAMLTLFGCGSGDTEQQAVEDKEAVAEATSLTSEQLALVNKAAVVAIAITKAPETMSKVLAENNLTADEYQSLIYKISSDPVLTRAYEEARKN